MKAQGLEDTASQYLHFTPDCNTYLNSLADSSLSQFPIPSTSVAAHSAQTTPPPYTQSPSRREHHMYVSRNTSLLRSLQKNAASSPPISSPFRH